MESQELSDIIQEKGFFGRLFDTGKRFLYTAAFLAALSSSAKALDCGDCNSDGRKDILDALVAAQHATGVIALQSPQYEACNVAGTSGGPYIPGSTVDVIDALKHAQVAAGIIPVSSCILERPILFATNRDGNSEIYTMNRDGSNPQRLTFHATDDTDPSWSSDGSKIVFASRRDGQAPQIYTMNRDGSNQTRLTTVYGAFDHYNPIFNPTVTNRILFESTLRTGDWEIYVMMGSGISALAINLTNNPYTDLDPDWSPDGTKIAFSSNRTGYSSIFVMDFMLPAGGPVQRLTFPSFTYDELDFNPVWNPQSDQIGFTRRRDDCWFCPEQYEVYRMDISGGNIFRLTDIDRDDRMGNWSPDGSKIIFSTNRNGNYEIYEMDSITGGSLINLTNDPASDASPK